LEGKLCYFLKFYNIWLENQHVPKEFLLIRYEDIHREPQKQLRKIKGKADSVVSKTLPSSSAKKVSKIYRKVIGKNQD